MIQKTTLSFTKILLLFSIIIFTKSNCYAQAAIVPQPLEGLQKLCAGPTFNEFFATFSYVNFPAGTTFEVELSDAQGSFLTSTTATIKLSQVDISPTQQTIKFGLPTNLVGSQIYGIRIKSSTGVASARFRNSIDNASEFPAYYKIYESTFSINKKNTSAVICSGGSVTLSVDNDTPAVPGSSPLLYPNLSYVWYKDNVVIAGQNAKDLVVNTPGTYYAAVNYGSCTDENIASNRVSVASSGGGSAVTIDSSLGNPFCSNGDGTVLTATSGNSYVWTKDGKQIGTTRSINAKESGVYNVEVDFGGCKASGSINLQSNGFSASIDVPETNSINEGETLNVSVTTDAANPTFEWFLNGNAISGAASNSYLVAVPGNYRVKISQATGCISSQEFNFRVTGPSQPSSVIQNIIKLSGLNPYWNIPDEYKNANTKVIILSSNGEKVLDVVNYQGDWPQTAIDFKNVNPVYYYVIQSDTGEKKGSITVIK
jgi:hypothetical protein